MRTSSISVLVDTLSTRANYRRWDNNFADELPPGGIPPFMRKSGELFVREEGLNNGR